MSNQARAATAVKARLPTPKAPRHRPSTPEALDEALENL